MMRKFLAVILAGVITFSFTACGGFEQKSGNDNQESSIGEEKADKEIESEDSDSGEIASEEENKEVKVDTSWYTDDNTAICEGVYRVGTDIVTDNYILTARKTEYTMRVTIFENQEKYLSYHRADKRTGGEEDDAIAANAVCSDYVGADEEYALNLKEGNVLLISNGSGTLTLASGESEEKGNAVTGKIMRVISGTYQDNDIKAGTYMLSCTQSQGSFVTIVFSDKEAYAQYESADKFNGGEEDKAVAQNAWSRYYIQPGETVYLNVTEEMVIVFDFGKGQLEPVSMNWAK